ncbi:MAG: RNA 2',3'-cyclic phosphodiesterase [Chloroflexi bacterium]|nr:RNA 2',3'-cyclic phosphodiesterase [Chloroflexota bacterium]
MDRAAASRAPLTLVLNETGCFPNANRPRVIWLGLAGEIAALAALKANLDERLIPLGWQKEERPFQAHLTVGRVKETGSVRTVEWRVMVQQVAIPVTAVHLIESQLTPKAPSIPCATSAVYNRRSAVIQATKSGRDARAPIFERARRPRSYFETEENLERICRHQYGSGRPK